MESQIPNQQSSKPSNQALGPLAHIREAQWESPKATWVPAISEELRVGRLK